MNQNHSSKITKWIFEGNKFTCEIQPN